MGSWLLSNPVFQAFGGLESRIILSCNLNDCAGSRIAALASSAIPGVKLAEPGNGDFPASVQFDGDNAAARIGVEDRIDDLGGLLLGYICFPSEPLRHFRLVHIARSFHLDYALRSSGIRNSRPFHGEL